MEELEITETVDESEDYDCLIDEVDANEAGKMISLGVSIENAGNNIVRQRNPEDSNNPQIVFYGSIKGVYAVTIDDYLSGLKHLDSNNVDDVKDYLDDFTENTHLSTCVLNKKGYRGDLFFSDDTQLIVTTSTFILHYEKVYGLDTCIKWVINAVESILSNRDKPILDRNYNNDALRILVNTLQYCRKLKEFTPEINEFYEKSQNKLLELEDPMILSNVGFQYYSGKGGKELDFYKSEKYLSRAFELSNDKDLCRPLGYIAYYGRTNNGVPEGDKAFKYFKLAHEAGLAEGSFKLSDCYKNGYGTPVDLEMAKKIIDDEIGKYREKEEKDYNYTDYASFALRKASFLLSDGASEENKKQAYELLLEARFAIKKRMNVIDYTGDQYISWRICENIASIEGDLNRVVSDKGILLTGDTLLKVFDEDVAVYAKMEGKNLVIWIEETQWKTIPEIGFSALTPYISVVFEGVEPSRFKDLMSREIDEYAVSKIEDGKFKLELFYQDKYRTIHYKKAWLRLYGTKSYEKVYEIANIQCDVGGFDCCLLRRKKNVGNRVSYKTKDGQFKGKILNKRVVYEDQMPLALKKMPKCR